MRPVSAGMWRQHETWDGTYCIDDLFDAVELLDLKEENEHRYRQWAKQNRGAE